LQDMGLKAIFALPLLLRSIQREDKKACGLASDEFVNFHGYRFHPILS
jgi:hypothetical protein